LRSAERQLQRGRVTENATTQAERQRLQKESDVSGVSILYTLHAPLDGKTLRSMEKHSAGWKNCGIVCRFMYLLFENCSEDLARRKIQNGVHQ